MTTQELIDLRKKIISDYLEHYDFPWQGRSHMEDCIDSALDHFAERSGQTNENNKLRIGGHDWVGANDVVKWPHCAICGIIRRKDDNNKPCKGASKIALREFYTEGEPNAARQSSTDAQQNAATQNTYSPLRETGVESLVSVSRSAVAAPDAGCRYFNPR